MKINRENKRKAKIIKNLANNITVLVTVISLFIIAIITFNNKTIVKDKPTKTKALDQEGKNYRLVTSADNVQVPVPKGYVTSQITGENYVSPQYQHTTNIYKVESTPTELNWSSPAGQQYPWTQDENGIWISGNQGIPNSESILESEEFDYVKGTTLTINYTYSNQWGDYFYIDLMNLTSNTTRTVVISYGNTDSTFDYTTSNYTYTMNDWATGRYKIKAWYKKDKSINEGQDRGYIKTSTYYKKDENGTQTFEEDIKTKIHDGGFVIYQLTDEEIETDPNGTNIVINDTNKDTAQSTRNQYVWVPVPNIEDILRTKERNNGIMQFGQVYSFRNTSITKETNTGTDYFREPRLVEHFDTTKYYLQRYSNLNKRENYLNEQQEEFKNMINSVNKYGGYYIGRYETGDEFEHKESEKCYIEPKIVRYNSNIAYVTWYSSYQELEKLSGKTEKYVETGMIYDSLWDYTIKWINETDTRSYEDLAEKGDTWGNYVTNRKTVTIGSTNPAKTGAIDTIIYKGETYRDSPTSSNNIFDIAGNVVEYTRARAYHETRRYRGGSCSDASSNYPAYSANTYVPYGGDFRCGTRGMLYIR